MTRITLGPVKFALVARFKSMNKRFGPNNVGLMASGENTERLKFRPNSRGHVNRPMRSCFVKAAVLTLAMLLPDAAKAQGSLANIPGLWLTGVDGAGNPLTTVGATDPHYRIVSRQPYSYPIGTTGGVQSYTIPLAPAVVDRNGGPCTGLSGWFVPSSGCWIWFDTAASSRDVIYTFRLTFDLTGFDHTTASISGKATADDFLDIVLNGTAIGSYADFARLHSFSATSGFVAGLNHLDFAVTGTGYADGLLVDELSGTAVRVPEPSSVVLLAAPLLALAVLARRKRTP